MGSFPVAGSVGEPTRFAASLSFEPPAANGPLRAEIFELNEQGLITANGVIDLRWGP
ncbi:MAG: hypothetical protein HGA45_39455 [Chloroflexales bacterium]|nr:hypothetical protein [Chloroflexales bacterium]